VAVGGSFSLLSSTLISEIKTRSLYIVNIIYPILKIILFVALIPFYGIWGMVWAILAAEVVNGVLVLYFFKRI
jgi:O-antigen/teichoic acid export membrane protein